MSGWLSCPDNEFNEFIKSYKKRDEFEKEISQWKETIKIQKQINTYKNNTNYNNNFKEMYNLNEPYCFCLIY
jgi:hypothetical protein